LRVAGKVEPLFVEAVADLPAQIAATAKAGDVVIVMGAGTIGAVPAQTVELLTTKKGVQP
jgi:UDP-N-acetylmuramate--alanine ligase